MSGWHCVGSIFFFFGLGVTLVFLVTGGGVAFGFQLANSAPQPSPAGGGVWLTQLELDSGKLISRGSGNDAPTKAEPYVTNFGLSHLLAYIISL